MGFNSGFKGLNNSKQNMVSLFSGDGGAINTRRFTPQALAVICIIRWAVAIRAFEIRCRFTN